MRYTIHNFKDELVFETGAHHELAQSIGISQASLTHYLSISSGSFTRGKGFQLVKITDTEWHTRKGPKPPAATMGRPHARSFK